MQLLIKSTDMLTIVNGQPCRVWEGHTEGGVRCLVYVQLVSVPAAADTAAFEAELRAQLQPAELTPLAQVLRGVS